MKRVRNVVRRVGVAIARTYRRAIVIRRAPVAYPSLHYRYSHDIANVINLRMAGFRAHNGVVNWKLSRAMPFAAMSISPFLVAAVAARYEYVPTSEVNAYLGWIFYMLILGFVFVPLFARIGVSLFHGLTPALEEALTPEGRRAYDRWADFWTASTPQYVFAAVFGAGAGIALKYASQADTTGSVNIHVGIASYVSVVVTGFLVACGAYWSIGGSALSYMLSVPGRLRLSPYAPASTPGLEMLSRYYRLAFYAVSIGVALCMVPILSWAYASPGSWHLAWVKRVLFGVSVCTSLVVGIVPQLFLSRAVARERRISFNEVSTRLDTMRIATGTATNEDSVHIAWLQTLTASRVSTLSESAIVGIVVGAATTLAPLVVPVLIR